MAQKLVTVKRTSFVLQRYTTKKDGKEHTRRVKQEKLVGVFTERPGLSRIRAGVRMIRRTSDGRLVYDPDATARVRPFKSRLERAVTKSNTLCTKKHTLGRVRLAGASQNA